MEIFRHKLITNEKWIELTQQLEALKRDASDATDFVREIETGNLDAEYHDANDSESAQKLAASLISMRDKMKKVAIEDKQRSWTNEGLAQFVEILRSNNENLESLSDNIISNLVKYLKANQGILFLLNDEDPNDIFLEVGACYAYNRKKFLKKRIEPGDGLSGQAILEKETIYMTEVPESFIRISSGLGEALPRNILIVPLKIENEVYGVIEIAAFHLFKPFEIQFIEKLSESIASTISAVRVNERTRKLLEESQFQAEQLKTQEEEIRQNMEELSSTQEEMERVMAKIQSQERYMKSILDASKDSILTIDKDFKVLNFNTNLKETYKALGFDINVGFDVTTLLPTEEEKRKHIAIYKRVLAGETIELPDKYNFNGLEAYYIFFWTPIRNEHDEIIAIAIFLKDVTEINKAKEQAQQQSEDLRAQEEELRQNMEELSTTQEEMERVMVKIQSQERYMKNILNASKDSILTIDKDFKVLNFNTNLKETYKALGFDINVGFDVTTLLPTEEEKQKHIAIYKRVLAGETIELPDKYNFNGMEAYYIFFWTPIRDEHNEIIAIAIFLKDVTEINKAKELAQQQAEDLKAQEEELRQNMEELSTTQEEIHRILKDSQEKEAFIVDLINSTNDTILTIDKEYKIILCNKKTSDTYSSYGFKIEKGFDIFKVISPEEKDKYKALYDRALGGEHFEITESYKFGELDQYYAVTYSPLRNDKGEVIAAAAFGKDITESVQGKLLTEKLLGESQQQEEELRQNMEELSATQEEIQRILKDVQEKEAFVVDLINSSTDTILTIDKDYKIILCNKATVEMYKSSGLKIEKGFDIFRVISPEDKEKYKAFYDRALSGEYFEITESYKFGDVDKHYALTYSPLRNDKGEVTAAAVFTKDITETVLAKLKTEKLLSESQQQEEELRQNMEELSATQEEVQKVLREIQSKEQYLSNVLNASDDMIVTIGKDLKIISCNTALKENYKHLGFEIDKGFDILKLLSPEEQENHKEIYSRVFAGEKVEIAQHYTLEDIDKFINFSFSPIKDEQGEITSLAIYALDVTEISQAKNEIEKNEKYITDLLNLSGDSIITIDRNYKVVTSNDVFRSSFKDFGMNITKGFDILNFFNEKEKIEKIKLYDRVFAGETHEDIDHISENGMDNYYSVKFAPLYDKSGRIENIAIFAKDITEIVKAKQNAEKLLEQSHQQTEEIKAQDEELRQNMEELSSIQDEINRQMQEMQILKSSLEVREKIFGITTILSEADLQGNITMVNDKLCEISQFSREELIGKPHSTFRHPDMPKELFKAMWKTLKKGEPFIGIIKNKKKDGSHYWVDAVIVPVKDDNGKTVKYVGARYHYTNDEIGLKLYNDQAKKMNLPTL